MTTIKDDFNNTPHATASGKYVLTSTAGEKVQAFIPHALPPHPPIQLDPRVYDLME